MGQWWASIDTGIGDCVGIMVDFTLDLDFA